MTTETSRIDRFQGPHAFLSNFHLCVVRITPAEMLLDAADLDVETYPSVEHAFQAAKTFNPAERRVIREASLPSRAKKLGRRVLLRADWERVKEDVMLRVLRAKFRDDKLAKLLVATGERRLIEGNTWDDMEWGCVRRGDKWIGANKLGLILEVVRQEIVDATDAIERAIHDRAPSQFDESEER